MTKQTITEVEILRDTLQAVLADLNSVFLGKPDKVKLALTCVLAGGHLLLEDLPGMGKTTLAKALACALGLDFKRVQFTADMFPSDLLGVSVYRREDNEFNFIRGPIFTHILLADEINRTPPKTQSALMEGMAEGQVSVDGVCHNLPQPFFVIATQNPIHQTGTFPLPESQLDRFTMCLSLGFPAAKVERQLLLGNADAALCAMPQRLNVDQLLGIQQSLLNIRVTEALVDYLQRLLQATRDSSVLGFGLSPRAGMSVLTCARAWAMLDGFDFVRPEDIKAVFVAVSAHRINAVAPAIVQQELQRILAETAVV